jgi:hypothetical protein
MRMLRPAAIVAVAALVAGCGSTAAVRSAATTPRPDAAGPWWTVRPPAVDSGTEANQVAQVAAVGRTDAWAVGASSYPNKGEETATTAFADHWNGTGWSRTMPPATRHASEFTGVAATGPGNAWIVGDDNRSGVIDHWNGARWSRSYTLRGSGDDGATMSSVVATSPRDAWAVGTLPHSTVQRSGIAVTITLDGATTVLLHWDGTRWSRTVAGELTNDPHLALASLAATGPRDVWAAGLRYRHNVNDGNDVTPLLAHWDGATWSIAPTPAAPDASAQFRAVTAITSTDAWAVGNSTVTDGVSQHPLAEHWNGRSWSIETPTTQPHNPTSFTTPTPPSQGSFIAAAGDGQGGVYTVLGGFTGGTNGGLVHWTGQTWTPVTIATPGLTAPDLTTVTPIPGTRSLWAAGGASPTPASATTPAVPLFATTLPH